MEWLLGKELAYLIVGLGEALVVFAIVRLGKRSLWLPLLQQLLPAKLLGALLKRRFGLNQISVRRGAPGLWGCSDIS